MIALTRWLRAQKYERSFWTNLATEIEADTRHQLDWYKWKASQLETRLEKYMDGQEIKPARILEIGSGPIGIVNFLGLGESIAIDPLEDFYKQNPTLSRLRRPGVTYLKGTGESLPFYDGFFSLVIIDNVIDHALAPEAILQQIYRVLRENGLLYFTVNVRTKWGTRLHKLLALLSIDKGHPHSFTQTSAHQLLRANKFRICGEDTEDYYKIKKESRKSKSVKEKLKGYTGMCEFQYFVVATKC